MPTWRQYFNRLAGGFMCLLFAGLLWMNTRILFAPVNTRAESVRTLFSMIFMVLPVSAIVSQFRFQRRIICEFGYDGYTLQYRTLGNSGTQMRPLQDLARVEGWSGRGGPMGYRLIFQDGGKLYLEISVANSMALAEQLREDARI
jgi:hypothetical protein